MLKTYIPDAGLMRQCTYISIYTGKVAVTAVMIAAAAYRGRCEGGIVAFTYKALGNDNIPDSKVHGCYMGTSWGRQDPGGPHVGPMNLAIWDVFCAGK